MEFSGLKAQYQTIREEIGVAINNVLQSGNFVLGRNVDELEKRMAEYVGIKYCIGVSSGSDALALALMAEGVGPGDAVFTTAFSAFATAEAISLVGAEPVFCDINPDTFNMDPYCLNQAYRRVLRDAALKPKAVISVDTFGQCADYDNLESVCQNLELILIEDAAQSMGATYHKKRAGGFGHYAATSFSPGRPLGCYGEGGAVFCANQKSMHMLRSLRTHGQETPDDENERIGRNARLDELQAAILCCKLDIFPKELERRNEVAIRYNNRLADYVKVPRIPDGLTSSYAGYTIALRDSDQRDSVKKALSAAGVPTVTKHVTPVHMSPAYKGRPFHAMPNAQELSTRILSLPIHAYLTDDEVDFVCKQIISCLGQPSWQVTIEPERASETIDISN